MGGDFGSDYFTILDEEGNEFDLEHLDTLEYNDQVYMAFLPADMEEDDEDFGIVILKVVVEDEEDALETVNDEDELNEVYELFVQRLSDEDDDGN